jgi:hypothetical protein
MQILLLEPMKNIEKKCKGIHIYYIKILNSIWNIINEKLLPTLIDNKNNNYHLHLLYIKLPYYIQN